MKKPQNLEPAHEVWFRAAGWSWVSSDFVRYADFLMIIFDKAAYLSHLKEI